MKKAISLILALVICLSLCACGNPDADNSANSAPNNQQSATEAAKEPQEAAAEVGSIALGEEITLDFVKMSFNSIELGYSVGGDGISSYAQDGMRFFSLVGKIENTGGTKLEVEKLNAEMIFNGEYTYSAKATINNSKTIPVSVAPLANAEYVVYAEIPDALLEILSTCVIRFSLNEGFASFPASADGGEYSFEMSLDEDACKAALDASEQAHIFFNECPILPTPENYSPVRQSNFSSSSSNGKVTSIRYGFSVNIGRNDSLTDIYATYVEKLQKAGFTISNDTGSSCVISTAGIKIASVSIDSSRMQFEIVPGNENLAAPDAGDAGQVAVPPAVTTFSIGETIQTDYVLLTLDTYDSDTEIRSGTSQYGTYTYYTSDNGDPYFYLFGTLKNLGGTPVDIRNIYVQFCFDGKYNFKGSVDGVSSASNGFIHDVSPLAEVNYYIYTAVPQELIDTFETCEVKIGFTENFDYKTVDVNSLPQFDRCDDVFIVKIA